MKQIFVILFFLGIAAFVHAKNDLKVEGSCNGILVDGSKVSFTYYSNFNGCGQASNAAIKFGVNFGTANLNGSRTFKNGQDIYTFNTFHVTFKDSTGNIAGLFSYIDSEQNRQSVKVQCMIRDYEYEQCLHL